MIYDLLNPQYPGINHRCVYRPYSDEVLYVRKHKKPTHIGARVPSVAAIAASQTWNMDFVSGVIIWPGVVSRRIKRLTVAIDSSYECMDVTADFAIGGHYIDRLLDWTAYVSGSPQRGQSRQQARINLRAFMIWM